MPNSEITFENCNDFEKAVALKFRDKGWITEIPPKNTQGYDIKATKNGKIAVIQCKNLKAKVGFPAIKRFENFLNKPSSAAFNYGIFVSSSGFAKTAPAYLQSENIKNIKLCRFHDGTLNCHITVENPLGESQIKNSVPATETKEQRKYFGVFTCKGGVGKTTISAHLAGGFALCGYDSILLDLDIQGNLRNLLNDGVCLSNNDNTDQTITIMDHSDWEPSEYKQKIVICDCNPNFEANSKKLIEQFDYCIIPTTLTPLGVSKNGGVILRTIEQIRSINKTAKLFIIINQFIANQNKGLQKRNEVLNNLLIKNLKKFMNESDSSGVFEGVTYIDPFKHFAIRNSASLAYFGYEVLAENKPPELAFKLFGGRSHPREDFLNLVHYLEENSDITDLLS